MINKASTPTQQHTFNKLISKETLSLLAESGVLVDIKLAPHCYQLKLPFKVAGVPAQLFYDDIPDNQPPRMNFTKISKHDIGCSDIGTIEGVLIRLKQDLSTTSYWAIYLHELEKPNKKGLTKVYRLESHSSDAKEVYFAGFAYRTKNGISPRLERTDAMKGRITRSEKLAKMTDKQLAVWEENWETSVIKSLKEALLPLSFWASDLFLEITYKNTNTGENITKDKFCRIDAEQINQKIKIALSHISESRAPAASQA